MQGNVYVYEHKLINMPGNEPVTTNIGGINLEPKASIRIGQHASTVIC